jgi:Holliday junction resolvasome RuvABC endonuclease subunit
MTRPLSSDTRVLAIDPTTKGFGFVVLEGPERLIDWGVACVGGDKNLRTLLRVTALIRRYSPEILVIEDHTSRMCRRRARVRELLRSIARLGPTHSIAIHRGTRRTVRAAFAGLGVATKYPIAVALASRFPDLAPLLPPKRKPWMSEDARMGIFDATALAVAYFETEQPEGATGEMA